MFAIVDDEDFEYLNQWKWCANQSRKSSGFYALKKSPKVKGKWKTVYMHRVIINAEKGFDVDHINHNGLDNRKANLRQCTNRQNQHNAKLRKNNTSGYKGVNYHKTRDNFRAYIQTNGKQKHLGSFTTAIEAAKAYDKHALKYFGEFANINFPEGQGAT